MVTHGKPQTGGRGEGLNNVPGIEALDVEGGLVRNGNGALSPTESLDTAGRAFAQGARSNGRSAVGRSLEEGPDGLNRWMRTLLGYVRSGRPDLTNRQMAVLLVVALTPGPHTVRGLARGLNVSKPVVTRALNRLGTLGYLRRQRDESDRRNIFVSATGEGVGFLELFQNLIEKTGDVRALT